MFELDIDNDVDDTDLMAIETLGSLAFDLEAGPCFFPEYAHSLQHILLHRDPRDVIDRGMGLEEWLETTTVGEDSIPTGRIKLGAGLTLLSYDSH
jgi:hypothetical protein